MLVVKAGFKILVLFTVLLMVFSSCKKDKILKDNSAKVSFSDETVLFDTVFTSIGSATRHVRVRNQNNQRINISSIRLKGGTSSQFIVNVDGAKGVSFSDIEIAANDSMYIFIQVNVNPNNLNSPIIVEDELEFVVNGNTQIMKLEAWGQDAYYHHPTNAIKFRDGQYLPYSLISKNPNADTIWKKDKPHVIYGYLVVDSAQKLTIQAGVQIYLNYKAAIWVYRYGQLRVLGQKDKEVVFQSARREKDYADEEGQWDRIWINEGSTQNKIDYAIIKNGVIGIQAERFGNDLSEPARLTITNTKIQNMSLWGMYCVAYSVTAGNNVISNCQEFCLNLSVGGDYKFYHCTFANFWNKAKARENPAVHISNYTKLQVLPLVSYFGNCIIDGKRENEINLDIKEDTTFKPSYVFSNCWLKTNAATTNTVVYKNVRTGTTSLAFKEPEKYNFEFSPDETRVKLFNGPGANSDLIKYQTDIKGVLRKDAFNGGVTAGAYEFE